MFVKRKCLSDTKERWHFRHLCNFSNLKILQFYKLKIKQQQQQKNLETLEFHFLCGYLDNISPVSEKRHFALEVKSSTG